MSLPIRDRTCGSFLRVVGPSCSGRRVPAAKWHGIARRRVVGPNRRVSSSASTHDSTAGTRTIKAGAGGDVDADSAPHIRGPALRPRLQRSAPAASQAPLQPNQERWQLPSQRSAGAGVGAPPQSGNVPSRGPLVREPSGAAQAVHDTRSPTHFASRRPRHQQQPYEQQQQQPYSDVRTRAEPHGQPQPQAQPLQARRAAREETGSRPGFPLRTGMALTWLGTNSGSPTLERNVSCTLVRQPGAVQMVDCGEGTHRQLMALRGSLDLAEVDGIFITHLHGDHCFGLPAALAALDGPKAAGQPDPERRRHHVYGPPGLAELVRVSMISTGLARRLQLPVIVTEFVDSPAAAHPLKPLVSNNNNNFNNRQRRPGSAAPPPQPAQQSNDDTAQVFVQRMAPRRVAEATELSAAVDAVQPRVAALEEIWSPPYQSQYSGRGRGFGSGSETDSPELGSSVDDDGPAAAAARRVFVAAEGLFWEIPGCAGVRVRAAQLQHRVPCWGYVFTELKPYGEGTRRRKVVVLGDTVSSRPIAPLAAGCDVLSHEATFARGMEAKARVAQHSTGWMAGAFAAAVGARSLVLTHFSARYREGPRDQDLARSSRITGHLEAEQQSWAVAGLLREAAATYGRPSNLFAATDFYTFHVPPRPAAPAPSAAAAAAAASGGG